MQIVGIVFSVISFIYLLIMASGFVGISLLGIIPVVIIAFPLLGFCKHLFFIGLHFFIEKIKYLDNIQKKFTNKFLIFIWDLLSLIYFIMVLLLSLILPFLFISSLIGLQLLCFRISGGKLIFNFIILLVYFLSSIIIPKIFRWAD